MQLPTERTAWLETVGLALIAVFLYQSGLLLMLFLAPLVMLLRRRGELMYGIGAAISFFGIAVLKLGQLSQIGDAGTRSLVAMDAVVPLLLLGGTYALAARRLKHYPAATRLGIGTLGVAAVATPLLVVAVQGGTLAAALGEQLQLFLQAFRGTEESIEPEIVDRVVEIALSSLLSFFVAFAGVAIGVNWYVGNRLAKRMFPGVERAPALTSLHIEPWWVWLVIGGAAGVLADVAIGIGILRYAAWNVLLFSLALYGAQGLGIMFDLLARKGIGGGGRIMAGITLLVLLFVPGLNLVVMLGVPGIGIAEIWVNFGRTNNAERSRP